MCVYKFEDYKDTITKLENDISNSIEELKKLKGKYNMISEKSNSDMLDFITATKVKMTNGDSSVMMHMVELERLAKNNNKRLEYYKNLVDSKRMQVRELEREFSDINKIYYNDIVITDHALVRHIERVMCIDTDVWKQSVIPEELKEKIKSKGDGVYYFKDLKFVIKNNALLTIIKKDNEK